MTGLERETLADGFRVGLLGVRADPRRDALGFHATLFDGGRAVATGAWEGSWHAPGAGQLAQLRALLLRVLAPPHILVCHGTGWHPLLSQVLPPTVAAELRVLDLMQAAAAMCPALPAHPALHQVTAAYGLGQSVDTERLDAPLYEAVLWAVVARAGARGLDWPGLLGAAATGGEAVRFERYAFDRDTLEAVPQRPGVYLMFDEDGQALYVGKAADLQRRLADYFRAMRDVPEKLRALREQIHDFEYRLVGSELEALLLENRLIGDMEPRVNVQRGVNEGAGRYRPPLTPVAVVCPAVKPGRAEIFFLAVHHGALQCGVDPRRPPRRRLKDVVEICRSPASAFRVPRGTVDWGRGGNEISGRYFARFRDQLHWLEVPATGDAPAAVAALLDVVQTVVERGPEPGEFRLG